MMTQREARQRLTLANASMRRTEYGEWRISLNDVRGKRNEDIAYYTDDLEDAVMTGLAMRRSEDERNRA